MGHDTVLKFNWYDIPCPFPPKTIPYKTTMIVENSPSSIGSKGNVSRHHGIKMSLNFLILGPIWKIHVFLLFPPGISRKGLYISVLNLVWCIQYERSHYQRVQYLMGYN